MNTNFGSLAQAEYRSRTRKRRIWILVGVLLIGAGYALMAVSPDTSDDWVLARAFGGLACIIIGFAVSIVPLLAAWTRGD